ncbi:MAG: hypothetical protein AAF720_09835 [Pseudomonadota bacterium]
MPFTAIAAACDNDHSFAPDPIFEPIGASSEVLVPDSSGAFIGGSIVSTTGLGWAKFGRFFLQESV